mgnify:CR=1 FL=1
MFGEDGTPKLIDFAPRFSGACAVNLACGVNLARAFLEGTGFALSRTNVRVSREYLEIVR